MTQKARWSVGVIGLKSLSDSRQKSTSPQHTLTGCHRSHSELEARGAARLGIARFGDGLIVRREWLRWLAESCRRRTLSSCGCWIRSLQPSWHMAARQPREWLTQRLACTGWSGMAPTSDRGRLACRRDSAACVASEGTARLVTSSLTPMHVNGVDCTKTAWTVPCWSSPHS